MKNIRLRAWDEVNEVMHSNFQSIRSEYKDNDWIIFISDKYGLKEHEAVTDPRQYRYSQFKKMRWIGVADCNGVDIYEGDIVRCNGGWLGLVNYYNSKAHYACEEVVTSKINSHGPIFDNWEELKVIGNIYENPELMKRGINND